MKKFILYIVMLTFLLSGCTSYSEVTELLMEKEALLSEEQVEPHAEIPVEKPVVETPAEAPVELPAELPVEEPVAETPVEAPAEPPVEPPVESPIEKSAEPPMEAPIEMPASDIDSLPNDNNGWGFVKKKNAFPEFTKGQRDMMAKYNCIYEGNANEKNLYLTFDEGYENGFTAQILDTLKEKGVPATFFITGPYLEKNGDLIRRMVDEGHIVGNHSVNHPNMPSKGTKAAMQEEILNLDRRFFELYGEHMTYFRPPEGAYSERSLAATNDLGYKTVLWSFAYKDWETDNQKGADYAFESVMPYLHNGCVILLHAVSKDNTEALGRIIDAAREAGYTFKSLDEFAY